MSKTEQIRERKRLKSLDELDGGRWGSTSSDREINSLFLIMAGLVIGGAFGVILFV